MYKYFKPIKKHDPFNYWLFENILSKEIINTLCNLKIGMPLILKNDGTREANNESRVFF